MTVPVTNAEFRTNFPEFASATSYLDSGLTFWFAIADLMLNGTVSATPEDPQYPYYPYLTNQGSGARWGTLLPIAEQLFVAHNLVLERQAYVAAIKGAPPGLQSGPVSSKGVGSVSIGYDTGAGIVPGDSHWNLTTYGTRLMWMIRMAGAGPVYVG